MEIFDFPYHAYSTKYPDSGFKMKLGKSYTFSSGATAPDQREITLHFEDQSMRKFRDGAASTPDLTKEPAINFNRLEKFYNDHKLHKSFQYDHPDYGMITVKFAKPLETPRTTRGGWVKGFSLVLEEQP